MTLAIDESFRAETTLRDGTVVRLRLLTRDDREGLARSFDRLSPRSRYRRFFTSMPNLPQRLLDDLVEIDNRDRLAIVAVADVAGEKGPKPQGVGIARFSRVAPGSDLADAAVAVIDDWQGKGLGKVLLGHLVEAAAERGIHRFRAHVLVDNEPMKQLLYELAPRARGDFEDGCLVYDLALPARDRGEKLGTATLYEVFRAAAHLVADAFAAAVGGDSNDANQE
jgi:GNAT superfamily N-acetyltransferase